MDDEASRKPKKTRRGGKSKRKKDDGTPAPTDPPPAPPPPEDEATDAVQPPSSSSADLPGPAPAAAAEAATAAAATVGGGAVLQAEEAPGHGHADVAVTGEDTGDVVECAWKDITQVVRQAPKEMPLGHYVASNRFSLEHGLNCIEMMDPKMDSGIHPQRRLTVDKCRRKRLVPTTLSGRMLQKITNQLLVVWELVLQGYAPSYTLMTFLFYHDTTLLRPFPLLQAFSKGVLIACSAALRLTCKSDVMDDEEAFASLEHFSPQPPPTPPVAETLRELESARGQLSDAQKRLEAEGKVGELDYMMGENDNRTLDTSDLPGGETEALETAREAKSLLARFTFLLHYLRGLEAFEKLASSAPSTSAATSSPTAPPSSVVKQLDQVCVSMRKAKEAFHDGYKVMYSAPPPSPIFDMELIRHEMTLGAPRYPPPMDVLEAVKSFQLHLADILFALESAPRAYRQSYADLFAYQRELLSRPSSDSEALPRVMSKLLIETLLDSATREERSAGEPSGGWSTPSTHTSTTPSSSSQRMANGTDKGSGSLPNLPSTRGLIVKLLVDAMVPSEALVEPEDDGDHHQQQQQQETEGASTPASGNGSVVSGPRDRRGNGKKKKGSQLPSLSPASKKADKGGGKKAGSGNAAGGADELELEMSENDQTMQRCRHVCKRFIDAAALLLRSLIKLAHQHKSRIYRKFTHIFAEVETLLPLAEQVDKQLADTFGGNLAIRGPCVRWLQELSLQFLGERLALGFELQLYDDEENWMIYWVLSRVHECRAAILSERQLASEEPQGSSTIGGANRRKGGGRLALAGRAGEARDRRGGPSERPEPPAVAPGVEKTRKPAPRHPSSQLLYVRVQQLVSEGLWRLLCHTNFEASHRNQLNREYFLEVERKWFVRLANALQHVEMGKICSSLGLEHSFSFREFHDQSVRSVWHHEKTLQRACEALTEGQQLNDKLLKRKKDGTEVLHPEIQADLLEEMKAPMEANLKAAKQCSYAMAMNRFISVAHKRAFLPYVLLTEIEITQHTRQPPPHHPMPTHSPHPIPRPSPPPFPPAPAGGTRHIDSDGHNT